MQFTFQFFFSEESKEIMSEPPPPPTHTHTGEVKHAGKCVIGAKVLNPPVCDCNDTGQVKAKHMQWVNL